MNMPTLPNLKNKYVKKEADKRFFRNPVKDPTKPNDTAPVTYEAIIQFLPLKDQTKSPVNIVPYYDIQHNGRKMFGLVGADEKTDPVAAFRSSCPDWKNKTTKDFYKKFFPKNRIYCNVLVRKNPQNPSQDNQVMLYNMSASLYKMCQEAMNPTVTSSLIDEAPEKFNPFNPSGDKALHLIVTRGSNGYPDFSKSKWVKVKPLTAKEIEKVLADTNTLEEFNGHSTNEDLAKKLQALLASGLDTAPVAVPQPVAAPVVLPVPQGDASVLFKVPAAQKVENVFSAPEDDSDSEEANLPF